MTLVSVGIAIWIVATTVLLIRAGHQSLPFWDEWDRWITWLRDGYSLKWFFEQHNQHRIALPKVLFALDHLWFHATNWFLLWCTFALQGVTGLLLWRFLMRLRRPGWSEGMMLAAVLVACLYSAQQQMNFIWAFQVQFVMVYTLGAAAFLAMLKSEERRLKSGAGEAWLAFSILLAGGATYTMSNGVLIWPVLIAASIWWRMPRARLGAVIAGALLLGAPFFYHWDRGDVLGDPMSAATRVWRFALFVLTHLGSPVYAVSGRLNNDSIDIVCGATVGAVLLAAWALAIVRVWRRRDPDEGARAMLLHVGAFLVATSCAFAAGRSDISLTYGFSSRYQTPAYIFWLCLLLCAWPWLMGRTHRGVLYAGICTALAIGIAIQQLPMLTAVTGREIKFRQSATVVVAGVFDEPQWEHIYYEPEDALPVVPYLRDHRLGLFTEEWTHWIGMPVAGRFRIRSGCKGEWRGQERVAAAQGSGWRCTGWEWDSPTPQVLVFVDSAGKVAGIGRTGLPNVPGEAVDWLGYVAGNPPAVTAYALVDDGRALCAIAGARELR